MWTVYIFSPFGIYFTLHFLIFLFAAIWDLPTKKGYNLEKKWKIPDFDAQPFSHGFKELPIWK